VKYIVDEYVLRFEISVDNVFLMHVLESISDLLYDGGCFFFRQFSFLLDLLKTAVREGFQNEVDVLLVVEVTVESG
jgi:hypothetical protein